jgi:hypothetical protein
MTPEKHDLWALLRETRNWVGGWSGILPMAGKDIDALRARIDAALAAHRDVVPAQDSAKDVVEWEERQGSYIHDDGVNELRVYLWGDQWHWHTAVEYRANGTCATEGEAKSAAIAAARGMR